MNTIIPTVFAITRSEFQKRLTKLSFAKHIHIDIMDGGFVRTHSLPFSSIPDLTHLPNDFEAHLMVRYPWRYIKKLKQKGLKKVIFHFESLMESKIPKFIEEINSLRMVAVIAVNPETSIKKITPFLSSVEGVLIMGVHPGREHQHLIRSTYKKILELRRIDPLVIIQVDGGVSQKNIRRLARVGASLFNVGSSIANANNPKRVFSSLERVLKGKKRI